MDYCKVSREEERDRGEDGGWPGDRKKGRKGRRGVQMMLQGSSSSATQEVAMGPPGMATQLLEVEDNGSFFRKPPGLVGFLGENKTALVL
jgi:hypothetical protein